MNKSELDTVLQLKYGRVELSRRYFKTLPRPVLDDIFIRRVAPVFVRSGIAIRIVADYSTDSIIGYLFNMMPSTELRMFLDVCLKEYESRT